MFIASFLLLAWSQTALEETWVLFLKNSAQKLMGTTEGRAGYIQGVAQVAQPHCHGQPHAQEYTGCTNWSPWIIKVK